MFTPATLNLTTVAIYEGKQCNYNDNVIGHTARICVYQNLEEKADLFMDFNIVEMVG